MHKNMIRKDEVSTNFCVSKVSFEYREIPLELAEAKHDRIMRMFVEALGRAGRDAFEEQIGADA